MAITLIVGDVATDTVNSSQRLPDISDRIADLEPNAAPLVVLLKRLRKRVAQQPKVEWLESEAMPRFDATTATATSVATSIGVANGNYFRVGDFVRNTATGEGLEVTATAAGALTVTRGIGSTTAAVMGATDELFIVGNVNQEGATLREIKTVKVANAYNYCQIERTPFGVTGTEAASKMVSGPELDRLEAAAALEHMRAWEQTVLFGARKEDTGTTGKPKRFAGGITEFVTTNTTNVGGALTESSFLTFLRTGFRYGSDRKVLVASPLVVAAIEGYARTNIQVTNDRASTYGIQMRQYVSGQGTVDIIMDRALADSAKYKGYAFLLDIDSLYYAPLRDTRLLRDRQANDADKVEHEFLTEATLVVQHERRHAIAYGITG